MSYSTTDSTADINHRFAFHPATTQEKQAQHGSARRAIEVAAHTIDTLVPPGREKSLALTKLEEAMLWANAGIARGQRP